MFSSEFPPENGQSDQGNNITLKDEAGRALDCYIEHSLELDGCQYLLLLPIDSPVEIVVWDDDTEDSQATLLEDEAEIEEIFSDAKAVLGEQNLILKHTAFTLTVSGELPEMEEEDILTVEIEDDQVDLEPDQFQLLANFYHKEEEFGVYTPVEPLLFFAKKNEVGQTELLSPEEFQKLQPMLEEWLFEEFD